MGCSSSSQIKNEGYYPGTFDSEMKNMYKTTMAEGMDVAEETEPIVGEIDYDEAISVDDVSMSTMSDLTQGTPEEEEVQKKESTRRIEYIYEYHRWRPTLGWGNDGNLFPSDPGRFSNIERSKFGNQTSDVVAELPLGWHVITAFRSEEPEDMEWEYSTDFENSEWEDCQQKNSCVRRRELTRRIGSKALYRSYVVESTSPQLPPVKRGMVRKQGDNVLHSFNDRYFVLKSSERSSTLTYFLNKGCTDDPPFGENKQGCMDLRGAQLQFGMGHIDLTSKDGDIYRIGNDSEDIEGWVEALIAHISYANEEIAAICDDQ